ncbi:MAG: hypothetical protein ACYC5O_15580 [Anaerolineae bacterium]
MDWQLRAIADCFCLSELLGVTLEGEGFSVYRGFSLRQATAGLPAPDGEYAVLLVYLGEAALWRVTTQGGSGRVHIDVSGPEGPAHVRLLDAIATCLAATVPGPSLAQSRRRTRYGPPRQDRATEWSTGVSLSPAGHPAEAGGGDYAVRPEAEGVRV